MSNSLSSNDEIQEKQTAYKVYQNRQLLGRQGDKESDWRTAEEILQSPLRSILFTVNCHLIESPITQDLKVVARDTSRWFLFSLPQLDWVKLLAVPLVLAAAGSIVTGQFQRESNQNAVLKAYFDKLESLTFDHKLLEKNPDAGAIVLARGRTVAALRELDLRRRIQLIAFLQASGLLRLEIFTKVEISPTTKKVISTTTEREPTISFEGQNLSELDLRRTDLSEANFSRSELRDADLSRANLSGANLSRAKLWDADLSGAFLNGADLSGASLINTNLSGAYLSRADLSGADLFGADLSGANLFRTKLSVTPAMRNLGDDYIRRHLAELKENLRQAKLCKTELPEGITLDPDRDCT